MATKYIKELNVDDEFTFGGKTDVKVVMERRSVGGLTTLVYRTKSNNTFTAMTRPGLTTVYQMEK